ncbi:MAG: winged helix-turn-helix domain-containing protein, partial [Bdellovibrionales bacterium]|nr:winged helix-turn-helix domain-containing protein [Bdellovibrionales bacterium]
NLTKRTQTPRPSIQEGQFRVGKASFDLAKLQVELSDGGKELLTDKEAKMLHLLWSQANRVVSRQDILNFVWGYQADPSPRTIDNFIVKLRKWIEVDPTEPQIILSHRGLGYSLHKPERNSES